MEQWSKVHSNYEVSTLGRVRNTKTGRYLKPVVTVYGYAQVNLGGKVRLVHRLVAEAFLKNPNKLPQVNHKDENKLNNDVSNLEWCDAQYNVEYSKAKEYLVLTPDGDVVEVFNLNKYCKSIGIDSGHLYKTLTGSRKQHKGYKLIEKSDSAFGG